MPWRWLTKTKCNLTHLVPANGHRLLDGVGVTTYLTTYRIRPAMRTQVRIAYADRRLLCFTTVNFRLLGGPMANESSTPSFTRRNLARNALLRNRFTSGRNHPGFRHGRV